MEKIAVLASGGLDSAALVAQQAQRAEVQPIYVRCGLAWEEEEERALGSFLTALNSPNVLPVTMLSAPVDSLYGDHWSVTCQRVPAADEPDEAVFLPGRNILLVGLAAIWCSTHEVSHVAIGSLIGNPFPDATMEFFQDFGRILGMGLGHKICVEAPFRDIHKGAIIKQFQHLPLELTMTCMAPRGSHHCGRCNKCRSGKVALRKRV